MNGGAWLMIGGAKVDVLLRDLDVVEHWTARAVEGVFEVDCLLAYVAGIPTYSLMAERAVARLLRGSLPAVTEFPERLTQTAPERWHYASRFSLEQARMRAARGDRIGTMGQAAKAVIEHAHAVLCERRAWVLNEKRIVEMAGLREAQALFGAAPSDLSNWVDALARTLC